MYSIALYDDNIVINNSLPAKVIKYFYTNNKKTAKIKKKAQEEGYYSKFCITFA